jgi:hypothetical protein
LGFVPAADWRTEIDPELVMFPPTIGAPELAPEAVSSRVPVELIVVIVVVPNDESTGEPLLLPSTVSVPSSWRELAPPPYRITTAAPAGMEASHWLLGAPLLQFCASSQ